MLGNRYPCRLFHTRVSIVWPIAIISRRPRHSAPQKDNGRGLSGKGPKADVSTADITTSRWFRKSGPLVL